MGEGARPNGVAALWSGGLALLRRSLWIATLTLLWSAAWTLSALIEQPRWLADMADQGVLYAGIVTLAGLVGGCVTGWRSFGHIARAAEEAQRAEEERGCCSLAERAAELERERHEFFNELTVVSALLQMKAYDRIEAYIERILAMRRPEPPGAGEGPAARTSGRSPEGRLSKGSGADPDPTGIVGLAAAVQAWACREDMRLHVRVTVDAACFRETDPGLVHTLAHLLERGLERARAGAPGERALEVGFIRAPHEDRLEVSAAGAPWSDDSWDLGSIRLWVEEMGGKVEVQVPQQGGSLVRVIIPVGKPVP